MAVTLRIDLTQGTQSVANNNTKIRARVYATSTYNSHSNDPCKGTLTLDGIKYNFSHSFAANTTTLLYDTTRTIQHDVNGNKTVKASATFATGVSSGTISTSKSLTLTQIKRRSQLNSIPKFTLESGTSISITKYASSYSDTLKIYQGSALIKTITNITNGYRLNFTEEELNTLYGLSLNSNTIPLTFTLTTYNGSTNIGSTSVNTTGIIRTAPPTILEVITNDSNEQTFDLTGNNQKYINEYSTLNCIIKAIAQKKAKISNFTIDGNLVNASYDSENDIYYCESSVLNVSKNPIQIYATDSRSNSSLQSITLDYMEYNAIEKGNIGAIRENDIGETVNLEFEGFFWNNNFNENKKNELTVKYFYKPSQDSSWIQGTTPLNLEINENRFSFAGAIKGDTEAGFDINYQYDLKVVVSDELSYAEFNTSIIAGKPAIALFCNKVSLGDKYDEELGGLQLNGDSLYWNGKIMNKNIVTARPTTYTSGTKQSIMPMNNTIVVGDKLSVSDNAIVIGEGVSKVKISGNGQFVNSSTSYTMNIEINIMVNNSNEYVAINYFGTSRYATATISDFVMSVQEGDKIQLRLWNNAMADFEVRYSGTWITVEVVE